MTICTPKAAIWPMVLARCDQSPEGTHRAPTGHIHTPVQMPRPPLSTLASPVLADDKPLPADGLLPSSGAAFPESSPLRPSADESASA